MAAAALVDLRLVERLIGEKFSGISDSDTTKLLPGQPIPTNAAAPFTQFCGCDFDTINRSTANDEGQKLIVTAEFLCACPVDVGRADAYQVMTAASAILAAIAEFSSTSGEHIVTLNSANVRRVQIEQLPMFRCVMITARGHAQRSAGTSRE